MGRGSVMSDEAHEAVTLLVRLRLGTITGDELAGLRALGLVDDTGGLTEPAHALLNADLADED